MAIINEHSGLEGSGIEESGLDDIDELHPKYLPRKDMLNLLVDLLIFNSSQSAVTALIAVCKSASDKPGILLSFMYKKVIDLIISDKIIYSQYFFQD